MDKLKNNTQLPQTTVMVSAVDFKVGQKVEVNNQIQPESEFWEKGYWKIPKGYKSIIEDIDEEGNCLIEYIEAKFYVDSKYLINLSHFV